MNDMVVYHARSTPDLVLINANVITFDPIQPKATWVALGDGKIVGIGTSDDLSLNHPTGVEIIDCRGRTVLPGFIDAHCHVPAYAEGLVSLSLSPREGVLSISDIQCRISEVRSDRAPGTWIRGKGYNEFYLAEQRHPNRWDLDSAASSHPVKLTHRSGHAHVLNSLALDCAGITATTGDPPGGLIDRDPATGEPTGILYGMGDYLSRKIPLLDDAELKRGVALANEKLLSYGITSVQDASSHNGLRQWRRFSQWKERGIFKPRVTMMMGVQSFAQLIRGSYSSRIEENQLRLGGVKIIVDETTGSLHPSQKKLEEKVLGIHKAGLQVIIHAVEEGVIEAACNAIEHALQARPRHDYRHRVEHCSVCPPHLVRRLHDLGLVVVTQPSFIYYHGDRYLKTVPDDQQQYLYPVGTMLSNGLLVAFSSDFPITDPNPLVGIYAAITRMSESGDIVLEGERVGRTEALRMYTLSAAVANFEEGMKGSVSPGKVADLVVLSENPLVVDADSIKDIQVEMTIVGGQIVWSRTS